jgi:hypothetical protein
VTHRVKLLTSLLALTLALGGCGAPQPPTGGGSTSQPGGTAEPVAPTEPATAEPTSEPASPTEPATPAATATAVPTEPATPAATATALGGDALLPAAVPWVRTLNQVYAQGATGQRLDLTLGGQFYPAFTAQASADGRRIAFSDSASTPRRLVVLTVTGGEGEQPRVAMFPQDGSGDATEGVFAPDGGSVAYTLLGEGTWQLRVADLESGAEQVIGEGPTVAHGAGELPRVPLPVSWTPAGILVQRALWGTDAPLQGVALIEPQSGAVLSEVEAEHLGASSSPDGGWVALVTGIAPIADAPRQGVQVLDVASGVMREVLPESSQFVKGVRWSPDGRLLLVSTSQSWEDPVTRLRVMNADGGNEQVVDFGVRGFWLDLRDIAWADSQTPLVLVSNLQERRVELHALPVTSFDATGLRPLGEFPQPDDVRETIAILYVPR